MQKPPEPSPWPTILQELMNEQGVSQRTLAEATGISKSTIARFLMGTAPLGIDKFEILLEALGYTLDAHPVEQDCSGDRLSTRDPRHLVATSFSGEAA